MNQAGHAHTALLAAAVFLDDRDLYAKYLHRLTVGDNPDPGRDVALDRQIRDNGQLNEMGRDQPHAHGDLATLAELAQTSFIQANGGRLGELGVDLFAYRDQRLLGGTEFFQTYNLGYDVPWSDHFVSGTEWYRKIATTGRGTFAELQSDTVTFSPVATLLYWHYRYVKGVRDSEMPSLAKIASMVPPDWNALIWTPAGAGERGRGAGAPTVAPDYSPNPAFDRFQASDWSATSGNAEVRNDPWQDADGSRLIVRDIQQNAWIQYTDFDFGDTPRGTFLLRGGASTKVPTQVAIYRDSLNGELIGTATIPATGWYTIFETTATALERPLTGKHTLVLQFSGSDNVYKWQGAVDWIKVAAGSAHAQNQAETAPVQVSTVEGPDGVGRTLGVGAGIGWRDFDFDNGRLSVLLTVQTSGPATLQLRSGSVDGAVLESYDLPDTASQWADLERPCLGPELLGRQDVVLVQSAGEPVAVQNVRWSEGLAPYSARSGVDRLATIEGREAKAKGETLTVFAGSTTTLRPVTLKSGAKSLAVTYAADMPGWVEFRSDDLGAAVIASGLLPATARGQQRTVELALLPSPTREHMLFLRNESALELVSVQADPVLTNPPRLEVSGPGDLAVGQAGSWQLVTGDPDGGRVQVRVTQLPSQAHYDQARGTINWTPRQVGAGSFSCVADDGKQLTTITRTVVVHR